MYSKNKGMYTQDYALTPPPGYDGSRFRRRSDGRDDAFPIYPEQAHRYRQPKRPKEESPLPCQNEEDIYSCNGGCPEEEYPCEDRSPAACSLPEKEGKGDTGIISFIEGLKSEELLLIALIVLLCTKDGGQGLDTVLILALLLCT